MLGTIVCLACLVSPAADTPKSAADLEARWRSEYPRAAERWGQVVRGFVAKGRISKRWFAGHSTETKDLTVASSGDKRLYIRARQTTTSPKNKDGIEPSEIRCQTPDFQFALKGVDRSDKYLLVEHAEYKEDNDSMFNFYFDLFAKNATTYLMIDLQQRMKDPSFVLKSIGTIQKGNDDLARIEYAYEGKYAFEDGSVDLDLAKDWAIRRVDVSVRSKERPSSFTTQRLSGNLDFP